MDYEAYGDLDGSQCDYALDQVRPKCDVYIKIFINDKLDYTTEKHANMDRGTFTFNYKTPRISKKAKIRFEMYDDDSAPIFGSKDDLLLSKTLTIDELTKQNIIEITAGAKGNRDNVIKITGSTWKDDFRSI